MKDVLMGYSRDFIEHILIESGIRKKIKIL
jgi:hypothetical protein